MNLIKANLNADLAVVYDQTKTSLFGRINQKEIDGVDVLGPPLNKFFDVTIETGVTPNAQGVCTTPNGRMLVLSSETNGLVECALYEINIPTGSKVYVGRIRFTLPDLAATTHVYRGLRLFDDGVSGWKIFLTTTGSVLINGGTFLVNNISRSDFVQVGFPTVPFATGNDQKAVYFLQEAAAPGTLHLQTNSAGMSMDLVGKKIYAHGGLAAAHQFWCYDFNTAPQYPTFAVTGTESTNLINHAGHTFLLADQVVFTSLTGGAGLTVGTVYFVTNVVPGVSYQLATTATTAGAGTAINFTTDISAANIGRAFGISTNMFQFKTGILPALSGTLLATDSEKIVTPQHSSLSGELCLFFVTTTNLYMGKVSELTSGATTWPSLITVNVLGPTGSFVGVSPLMATWSEGLDACVFLTNANIFVIKRMVNNQFLSVFGGTNNRNLEGLPSDTIELQMLTVGSLVELNGWLAILGATVGQRGIYLSDVRSDCLFGFSYLISPVINKRVDAINFISTADKLFEYTGSIQSFIRTSGFGSESGGWVEVAFSELVSFAGGASFQAKLTWKTIGLDTSIPAQIEDVLIGYSSNTQTSDHWAFSFDDSETGTPSKVAFRLGETYPGAVPEIRFVAYDLTDTLVVNHTTVTNPGLFEYSDDGGVSWNSIGTIPNVVGTLLRYTFASQPGTDIKPALMEA
jgi:hypothetical protein